MLWPRNAWYVAMYGRDLEDGVAATRSVLGTEIVLYRVGRDIVALRDRCPHRAVPLSLGQIQADGQIMCGYHGLVFDRSGRCTRNPHGRGAVPSALRVESFRAVEHYGMVWLWLGNRAPDEKLLPRHNVFDKPSGSKVHNPLWFRLHAPADLVIDNLLDLSHASTLHDGLLGSPTMIEGTKVKVEQTSEGLSVTRDVSGRELPAFFQLIFRGDGSQGNAWQNAHWRAPSYVLIDNGVHDEGQTPEQGGRVISAHIVTPETKDTSLYHLVSAIHLDESRLGMEEAVINELNEIRRKAFCDQDELILREQYRVLRGSEDVFKPVLLSIDEGAVRWRRILEASGKHEPPEAFASC